MSTVIELQELRFSMALPRGATAADPCVHVPNSHDDSGAAAMEEDRARAAGGWVKVVGGTEVAAGSCAAVLA